jgi:hypothetical protein
MQKDLDGMLPLANDSNEKVSVPPEYIEEFNR